MRSNNEILQNQGFKRYIAIGIMCLFSLISLATIYGNNDVSIIIRSEINNAFNYEYNQVKEEGEDLTLTITQLYEDIELEAIILNDEKYISVEDMVFVDEETYQYTFKANKRNDVVLKADYKSSRDRIKTLEITLGTGASLDRSIYTRPIADGPEGSLVEALFIIGDKVTIKPVLGENISIDHILLEGVRMSDGEGITFIIEENTSLHVVTHATRISVTESIYQDTHGVAPHVTTNLVEDQMIENLSPLSYSWTVSEGYGLKEAKVTMTEPLVGYEIGSIDLLRIYGTEGGTFYVDKATANYHFEMAAHKMSLLTIKSNNIDKLHLRSDNDRLDAIVDSKHFEPNQMVELFWDLDEGYVMTKILVTSDYYEPYVHTLEQNLQLQMTYDTEVYFEIAKLDENSNPEVIEDYNYSFEVIGEGGYITEFNQELRYTNYFEEFDEGKPVRLRVATEDNYHITRIKGLEGMTFTYPMDRIDIELVSERDTYCEIYIEPVEETVIASETTELADEELSEKPIQEPATENKSKGNFFTDYMAYILAISLGMNIAMMIILIIGRGKHNRQEMK